MQRDINWPESYTFEISVRDMNNGDEWMAQEPISWAQLGDESHRVNEGRLRGQRRAIKVMGRDNSPLNPNHRYEVRETVRNRAGGDVIYTDTYNFGNNNQNNRPSPSNQNCRSMQVSRNNNGRYTYNGQNSP